MENEEKINWEEHRKERAEKKRKNEIYSIDLLKKMNIPFKQEKGNSHYKVFDFDFWPTTGKFWNSKTKESGRGVRNLIQIIRK